MNKRMLFSLIYVLIIAKTYSQDISSALDSLYRLEDTHMNKLPLYNNVLESHERTGNFSQLGTDAHKLAKWLHKEKKWKAAIQMVQRAYRAREIAVPRNEKFLKQSYYNYAIYHKRIRKYDTAITYFRKLIDLNTTPYLRGRAYFHIGESYEEIDDLHSAVKNHLLAFRYFKAKKEQKYIINNHIGIGIAYMHLRTKKSAQQALKHFVKADSILKSSNLIQSEYAYLINNNIGGLFYEGVGMINVEEAITYFKKAQNNIQGLNWLDYECSIHYNLGVCYIEKDTTLADVYFKRALTLADNDKRLFPKIHMGLGMLAFSSKNYKQALEQYKQALNYSFNIELLDYQSLPSTSLLSYTSKKAELLELIKRKILAHLALAKVNDQHSEYHLALKTVKFADTLIEQMLTERHALKTYLQWRDLASEIYILGLEATYKTNDIAEAHYLMEKNKALLLTREINRNKLNIPITILQKEQEFYHEMIRISKEYFTAKVEQKPALTEALLTVESKLNNFKDSLSNTYNKYFFKANLPKIIPLEALNLRKDEVVLHYTMAEKVAGVPPEAYVLVMSNAKKMIVKLSDIPLLLKNIRSIRAALEVPFSTEQDVSTYSYTAFSLYETLIPNRIRPLLNGKKITIITDHLLNFVPFEALVTKKDRLSYLIETNEIHYEYSLSFSKENSEITRSANRDFLGVAPINFTEGLEPLKRTEKEVSTAETFYSGKLLMNTDATKENFINEVNNYKICHLATHANASDSIMPWIAFHNTKMNQFEFKTLKTQAELVVLSACNTSLGKFNSGEGVMSLARSFFKSGAHSVMSSLWNTNDKASYSVMTSFYNYLHSGQTTSQALRTAKLSFINSNRDAEASPHYWAPLILIGPPTQIRADNSANLVLLGSVALCLLITIIFYALKIKKSTKR